MSVEAKQCPKSGPENGPAGEPGGRGPQLIHGRPRDLGGFSVQRVLPVAARRMLGPFVFFDHMGPAELPAGRGIDVRPHPHIGLATVTYLFEGEIVHRDSLGSVQAIRPGAVNWMTAGHGIVHSERTGPEERARPSRLHGIQSWVALPTDAVETAPSFHHHPAATMPRIEADGVSMQLIAGRAYGRTAPVETLSEMFYLDARMSAGSRLALPEDHEERGLYVVEGRVQVQETTVEQGVMAACVGGEAVIEALEDSRLMLLGGTPLGERRLWWNFVAIDAERIERAKADWRAGRFPPVPGETEFIPLPED
ncbi:MAG: pirin family protein [Rhodospirillales bacterium]